MSETTALAQQQPQQALSFSQDQVDLIKRTIAQGASDDELNLFIYQCKRTGLDPFSRQIYCVKRWNKAENRNIMVIQTGIDGYRLTADRTGLYAGSEEYRYDEGLTLYEQLATKRGHPLTATATVYKIVQGQRVPYSASVAWDEYYPGEKQGYMWQKMPHNQLGKCAEALALRKAFPQELSGVYVKEEMDQAGEDTQPIRKATKTYDSDIHPQEQMSGQTIGQLKTAARKKAEAEGKKQEFIQNQDNRAWLEAFLADKPVNQETISTEVAMEFIRAQGTPEQVDEAEKALESSANDAQDRFFSVYDIIKGAKP